VLTGFASPGGLESLTLWLVRVVFVSVLVFICKSDLRERRIPNRLVGIGLAVALMWHAFASAGAGLFDAVDPGALGVAASAMGALAAFGLFIVLHLFRVMGAGDVKLMTMLGAFFGVALLPPLVAAVFAAGGLLVLVRLLDGERRRAVAANLRVLAFGGLAALAGHAGPRFDAKRDTADRLPFAFAIAGGAFAVAALQWYGALA
jgi:prepilin peptidase CpaA